MADDKSWLTRKYRGKIPVLLIEALQHKVAIFLG